MADNLPAFGSVAEHLIQWGPTVVPDCEFGDETPDVFPARFCQFVKAGGASGVLLSHPIVHAYTFGATRIEAMDLGHEVQEAIVGHLRGVTLPVQTKRGTANMTVSWNETQVDPIWTPYSGTEVERFMGVYLLTAATTLV